MKLYEVTGRHGQALLHFYADENNYNAAVAVAEALFEDQVTFINEVLNATIYK